MIDIHQKALEINPDSTNYGVFAEIGAGQEVARWLFRVGGASGTVAKAISAYDMVFENDLKVYVYPQRDAKTGAFIDADNLVVSPHLRHLYAYLAENRFIEPIRGYNPEYLPYYAGEVLQKIAAGDPTWQQMVPEAVAEIVRRRGLWGHVG